MAGRGKREKDTSKPSRQERQAQREAEQTIRLAQEAMPFSTVQGSFIRRRDGAKILLVRIAGTNDSLYTHQQKLSEAQALSSALVSVTQPSSILKIPKTIDSNFALIKIDAELDALKASIEACGEAAGSGNSPACIRYRLLRDRVRPKAEQEALAGDRFMHPTYISMEFDTNAEDVSALKEASVLVQRLSDVGKESHVCSHDEAIEALRLYFKPKETAGNPEMGRFPVMPKPQGGERAGRGARRP